MVEWWVNAFVKATTQSPIKVIRQGTLPTTAAALEGAGSPTILFICAVATVVSEVTEMLRTKTPAIFALQETWQTRTCSEHKHNTHTTHSKPQYTHTTHHTLKTK